MHKSERPPLHQGGITAYGQNLHQGGVTHGTEVLVDKDLGSRQPKSCLPVHTIWAWSGEVREGGKRRGRKSGAEREGGKGGDRRSTSDNSVGGKLSTS